MTAHQTDRIVTHKWLFCNLKATNSTLLNWFLTTFQQPVCSSTGLLFSSVVSWCCAWQQIVWMFAWCQLFPTRWDCWSWDKQIGALNNGRQRLWHSCSGSWCLFCLVKEAWFRQLEVVNGDTLPWLGGSEDSVLVLLFFTPPMNLGHGTKQAAGTSGSTDIGQSLGGLAVASKLLELLEFKVSDTIVPTHQLSLVVRSLNGVFFGLLKGRRRVKGQGGLWLGVWMLGFLRRWR
jgi:hypothetical protein